MKKCSVNVKKQTKKHRNVCWNESMSVWQSCKCLLKDRNAKVIYTESQQGPMFDTWTFTKCHACWCWWTESGSRSLRSGSHFLCLFCLHPFTDAALVDVGNIYTVLACDPQRSSIEFICFSAHVRWRGGSVVSQRLVGQVSFRAFFLWENWCSRCSTPAND